eukprot:359516_1
MYIYWLSLITLLICNSIAYLPQENAYAAQNFDEENDIYDEYYDEYSDNNYYDDEYNDVYDDLDDLYYEDYLTEEDITDKWFDEIEGTEWQVTNVAFDDEYDELWANDNNWEQIDDIQTFNGNRLQRKCLHMWGQRLCLCQFLAFLDNRKFQCQPKGQR